MTSPSGSFQESRTTGIRLAPLPCALVMFASERARDGQCFLPDGQVSLIEGPSQLRNDFLWVSNVSALEPVTHLYPNLRNNFYFRRRPAEIAADIGVIDPAQAGGEQGAQQAAMLSCVFTRVMTIAARAYGWDVFEMGPLRVREPYLMRDIGSTLPDDPEVDESLERALAQAYQPHSAPMAATYYWSAETFAVTLRFNEVSYAKQLLGAPVPGTGKWHLVGDLADWSDNKLLAYCLSRPTVVRASIDWDGTAEELSVLAAFGMSGQARGLQRRWITQPELTWISKIAKVKIHQFWVFDGELNPVAPEWQLPELLDTRPQARLSYSAGLVAYNHMLAVTQSRWDRHARSPRCSVHAAWLTAHDRAAMFDLALRAHNKGFIVDRYGQGSLRVRIRADQLGQLEQFKSEYGFMYPDLGWIDAQMNQGQLPPPGALRRKTSLGIDGLT